MDTVGILIQKLSGGGAERAAANLSIDLSPYYKVILIVFDNSESTYSTNGNIIDLKLPPRNSFFGKMINIINRAYKVRKIKKENNIICTISLMEGANIVNVLSKKKDKIVTSERNMLSFFIHSKLGVFKEKAICSFSDKVVALSEMVKIDLIEKFNIPEDKIVTIYNSVDNKKLKQNGNSYFSFEPGVQYIVTMGRLTYQKGQWHLLKAFKKVKQTIPNVKLIVIGQGELLSDYLDFIEELDIENDVHFLGFIENPHAVIKECNLFVFSSLVEGLANVLLEALACNKAIVSTDCDAGPREILAPDTLPNLKTKEIELAKYGILTPCFSPDKFDKGDLVMTHEENLLADAIILLLQDLQLRQNYENLAEERIKDFSPANITKQWKNLLEELV